MGELPLEGIRVLDSTYVVALPYAGGLLADMGAEVIKVEGPGHPDITRTGALSGCFPENDLGEDWWNRASAYNLLNRGKLSITLDLTDPRARDLFRELVGLSDVVMENYTPRVMRNWGLDYESLRELKPDIIMVSNTGYGHGEGPYSAYPAQATSQEANPRPLLDNRVSRRAALDSGRLLRGLHLRLGRDLCRQRRPSLSPPHRSWPVDRLGHVPVWSHVRL